ncbi:MAG: hypothetical protein C4320_09500, partial [Armatimonadota bacterium]
LMNGCCGGPTCPGHLWYAVPSADDQFMHYPAQLLDSAMNFAVLGTLLLIERKGVRSLVVTGYALFFHGLARFLYEFLRAGVSSSVMFHLGGLPFTEAHLVALAIMAIGAGLLLPGFVRRASTVRAA